MRSNSSVWLRARENAKLFSITMDQHQTEAKSQPDHDELHDRMGLKKQT